MLLNEGKSVTTRHRFVSRTYFILLGFFLFPLMVLVAFKLIFEYMNLGGYNPSKKRPYGTVTCLTVTILVLFLLSIGFESWRRYPPTNIILITILDLALTLTVGLSGSYVPYMHICAIFLVSIICTVIFVTAIFTGCQMRIDVQSFKAMAIIVTIVSVLLAGVTAIFVFTFPEEKMKHSLWLLAPAGLSLVYTIILFTDTRLLLNGAWPVHPNEYTFAAVTLFVNMLAFVFLLPRICGSPWKEPARRVTVYANSDDTSMDRNVGDIQIRPCNENFHLQDKKCRHTHVDDDVTSTSFNEGFL